MKDLSLNIKVSYLYRDAGNYKQFGSIVLINPELIPLDSIIEKIKSALIDGEYFIASKWQIPALNTFPFDEELDHNWHELENIERTHEETNDERSISEFLEQISQPSLH